MKTATMLAVLTMTLVSASQAQAQRLIYRGTSEMGWSRKTIAPMSTQEAVNLADAQIRSRINKMVNISQYQSFLGTNAMRKIDVGGSFSAAITTGSVSFSETSSRKHAEQWVANGNNWLILIENVRIKRGTWTSKTSIGGSFSNYGKRSSNATATMQFDYRVYGPEAKRSNPPPPQLAINPNTGWVYNVKTGQNVARAQRQVTNQFDQYGRQVVWYRYGNLQQKATPQPINNGGGNNGGGNNGRGNNGRGNANGNNLSPGEQIAVGILAALLQASQNNR